MGYRRGDDTDSGVRSYITRAKKQTMRYITTAASQANLISSICLCVGQNISITSSLCVESA